MKRHTPRTKVIVKMPPVMPPKKPEGESVARPSEEPARQSALGVVGGSLPVSKIEALCIELETDAEETDAVAGHQSNGYSRGWHDGFTASLRTVSTRLRELSGLPIKRQPEENTGGQPRP